MADTTKGAQVHPDLRDLVPGIQQAAAQTAGMTLAELRAAIPEVQPPAQPVWVERSVPGAGGAPDVRVYVINSRGAGTSRPAILHMHGGGYVRGTAMMCIPQLQALAAALDCVIVTVDYRLAPETAFPGALDDNYAGLAWLFRNAAELGVDVSRIAVMGESAGGGHAAMLAIAARDRGEFPLMFQALVYPMLDDRTGSVRHLPPHIGSLVWTPEHNREGWTAHLGAPAGADDIPPEAAPARLADLAGLPPAYIAVGALDLFVEEDIEYARRLIEVGIPVELNVAPGAFHGFDVFAPEAGISKQFHAALTRALQRAFRQAW